MDHWLKTKSASPKTKLQANKNANIAFSILPLVNKECKPPQGIWNGGRLTEGSDLAFVAIPQEKEAIDNQQKGQKTKVYSFSSQEPSGQSSPSTSRHSSRLSLSQSILSQFARGQDTPSLAIETSETALVRKRKDRDSFGSLRESKRPRSSQQIVTIMEKAPKAAPIRFMPHLYSPTKTGSINPPSPIDSPTINLGDQANPIYILGDEEDDDNDDIRSLSINTLFIADQDC